MCAFIRLLFFFASADIVGSRPRVELQECGQGDVDIPHPARLHGRHRCFFFFSCIASQLSISPSSIHRINRSILLKAAGVVASAAGAGMAVPFTFFFFQVES